MDLKYKQEFENNDEEYKIGLSKDIDYINENNENPPKIYNSLAFQ